MGDRGGAGGICSFSDCIPARLPNYALAYSQLIDYLTVALRLVRFCREFMVGAEQPVDFRQAEIGDGWIEMVLRMVIDAIRRYEKTSDRIADNRPGRIECVHHLARVSALRSDAGMFGDSSQSKANRKYCKKG